MILMFVNSNVITISISITITITITIMIMIMITIKHIHIENKECIIKFRYQRDITRYNTRIKISIKMKM